VGFILVKKIELGNYCEVGSKIIGYSKLKEKQMYLLCKICEASGVLDILTNYLSTRQMQLTKLHQ